MRKLAVFVEGQTEQIFVERLIREVAGTGKIIVESTKAWGGRKVRRKSIRLRKQTPSEDSSYYAIICDCGTDSRVGSDVRDNYDRLVQEGYVGIVGIRDVYPFARSDIPKLHQGLYYRVKTKPIAPLFVLAVMEIEAWFLAEYSHFGKIHPGLTLERIIATHGFDPSTENAELRDHPAQDLANIYQIERITYQKSKDHVERTVDSLDYSILYLEVSQRMHWLGVLADAIDEFLS